MIKIKILCNIYNLMNHNFKIEVYFKNVESEKKINHCTKVITQKRLIQIHLMIENFFKQGTLGIADFVKV